MYHLVSLRIHRYGVVFGRNVFGQRWCELWKGDLTPAVVVTIDRRQTKSVEDRRYVREMARVFAQVR